MLKRKRKFDRRVAHPGGIPSVGAFRLRLMMLVIAGFLPIFGLTILSAAEQRTSAEKATTEEMRRLVRLVVADQSQAIEGVRQLLVALSQLSEVRRQDTSACNAFFETLIRQYGRYVAIGAADRDGRVFCSAVPEQGLSSVADRFWFNSVISTNNFYGSEYQLGSAAGGAQWSFGYPVRNAAGSPEGVVYAALDLSWLNRAVAQASLPENATFSVLDHEGNILVHYPQPEAWVGGGVPGVVAQRILSRQEEGTIVGKGFDGTQRLHAFSRLSDSPGVENFYAVVTIPVQVAFAEANQMLYRNIFALGIMTLLALFVAWFFGNVLVVRQIRALKDVDRLKSEFVSLASHQLRTPLTSISWTLDLVRSEKTGPLNEDQREFIDEAVQSARGLTMLVRDLLNLSRIEAGRLKVDPVRTDITELAGEVVNELQAQIAGKSLVLQRDFSADPLDVLVDPLLLRQVIMNFLSNAIRYTPEGGKIRVAVSRTELDVLVAVSDTGIGIPRTEQGKIFERFFRASNAHAYAPGGTGLGLYLAKSLVELSGGQIGFESTEGKGSVFWFTIPFSGSVVKEGEITLG